jgi:hypothetical protein
MSTLRKSIQMVAGLCAAIIGSLISVASASAGEFATFTASPGSSRKIPHPFGRSAVLAKAVLETLPGPFLGGNCYIGRRSLDRLKLTSNDGFVGLAGRSYGGRGEEGRHVTPVAVHGHCCA